MATLWNETSDEGHSDLFDVQAIHPQRMWCRQCIGRHVAQCQSYPLIKYALLIPPCHISSCYERWTRKKIPPESESRRYGVGRSKQPI